MHIFCLEAAKNDLELCKGVINSRERRGQIRDKNRSDKKNKTTRQRMIRNKEEWYDCRKVRMMSLSDLNDISLSLSKEKLVKKEKYRRTRKDNRLKREML